jgi:hypothetical protein
MAKPKKSRQPSASSATPRSYSEIYKNSTALPAAPAAQLAPANAVTPAVSAPAGKSTDLTLEYAFVRKELRDLFVVGLIVFAGMLAVGFAVTWFF